MLLPSLLTHHATVTRSVIRPRSPSLCHRFRRLLAKLLVQVLACPRPLAIEAYLWLASETDNLEEKRRCLDTVLKLAPENESTTLALPVLDQKRPSS